MIFCHENQCNVKLIPTYCDALRDLVSFLQFKKREKHTWRSVTFSCRLKLYNFPKSNTQRMFFTFLNYTNGTKSCKTSHLLLRNSLPKQ